MFDYASDVFFFLHGFLHNRGEKKRHFVHEIMGVINGKHDVIMKILIQYDEIRMIIHNDCEVRSVYSKKFLIG